MMLGQLMVELRELMDDNRRLRGRVEELESKELDNKRKLSRREVQDIRDAYRGGMRQKDLADAYQVNPATISRTVRGIYH